MAHGLAFHGTPRLSRGGSFERPVMASNHLARTPRRGGYGHVGVKSKVLLGQRRRQSLDRGHGAWARFGSDPGHVYAMACYGRCHGMP